MNRHTFGGVSSEPSILFAMVKDTKDPDGLGRIQVEASWSNKKLVLPWLRLVSPAAHYYLPEVKQEVAILCGSGLNPDHMVVLGVVFHGQAKPVVKDGDGKNNLKSIQTRTKSEFVIDDTDGKEKLTLQTGDKKVLIELDKANQKLTITGTKDVIVNADNVTIKAAKNVSIEASENVDIKATKNVTVKGSGEVTVDGAKGVTVKSAKSVTIQGTSSVDISGGKVNIG